MMTTNEILHQLTRKHLLKIGKNLGCTKITRLTKHELIDKLLHISSERQFDIFERLKVDDLRAICTNIGILTTSRHRKIDLIELLKICDEKTLFKNKVNQTASQRENSLDTSKHGKQDQEFVDHQIQRSYERIIRLGKIAYLKLLFHAIAPSKSYYTKSFLKYIKFRIINIGLDSDKYTNDFFLSGVPLKYFDVNEELSFVKKAHLENDLIIDLFRHRKTSSNPDLIWNRIEKYSEILDFTPEALADLCGKADLLLAAQLSENASNDSSYSLLGKAALIGGSIALCAITAGLAAPAIGGIIGTTFLGLSGAAATSAGLALLGGGALAAGGFGMAGGTALIAVTGGVVGAYLGSQTSKNYLSPDSSFDVRKVNNLFSDEKIICIDGFLTEESENTEEWRQVLSSVFPNAEIHRVIWESKTLKSIGRAFTSKVFKDGLAEFMKAGAKSASKKFASKLSIVGLVFEGFGMVNNPWWVAMSKARWAGQSLAEWICKNTNHGDTFTLVGHSLGVRVIFHCLHALSNSQNQSPPKIVRVIMLGGAIGRDSVEEWKFVSNSVQEKIVNAYTKNDNVLRYLYQLSTLGMSSPIGIRPLVEKQDILDQTGKYKDINCTQFVESHTAYKRALPKIFKKLL